MSQVGSTKDIVSQSITGVTDDLGNSVVSTSTGFASSPLGVSARAQALYGIANPNFNLTPPDVDAEIEDQSNPLPFWTIDNASDGEMSATTIFDETSQTYGVELNPGTAAIDSTLTLTTRSYILTDDNLALRQRALSVLSKSGTAAGTTQWNLTLTAIYYDATDTALSTAVIGTALDTGTWTSISGTTTPGGSAINSAAQYVDLSFKMTATAAVTGSAKATIKSLLLTTSTPGGGGGSQSFLIAETFTSSGDWVRPTGVEYLNAVVLVSGGGGGSGGSILDDVTTSGTVSVAGGGGGGGGFFAIARDLYVGDAGTWAVTVGAGGSGGTATTKRKLGGSALPAVNAGSAGVLRGGLGSNAGATSFGTYITLAGGVGGSAAGGGANRNNDGTAFGAAGTAGSLTTNLIFDIGTAGPVSGGGQGGSGFTIIGGTVLEPTAGTPGGAGMSNTLKVFPYLELPAAGNAGGTATSTVSAGASGLAGTAGSGGVSGIGGGGGGGGGVRSSSLGQVARGSGAGGSGGGGGGGASLTFSSGTPSGGTLSGTAGDGGAATSASGGGGGAGGGISARYANVYTSLDLTYQSGAGGEGSGGFVIIVYVG
jgi:hypothetical protein